MRTNQKLLHVGVTILLSALTLRAEAGSVILKAQVLLDRAHFSPGEIDGRSGGNTRRAVAGFNQAHGLKGGEKLGAKTWAALNRDTAPVVVAYVLTPEDVAGPFGKLPVETPDREKLSALGFESAIEAPSSARPRRRVRHGGGEHQGPERREAAAREGGGPSRAGQRER